MEKVIFKKWLKAALIRAIRTFFQTFAGCFTIGIAISDIDFKTNLGISLTAAMYSICTSAAGLPEIDEEKEEPEK